MELFVPVDRPTAAEAVTRARVLAPLGVGLAVGPRLLSRSGAAVSSPLADFGPVLADARIGGDADAVVFAARQHAAAGASRITVDARVGREALAAATEAAMPFGSRVVVVTIPPEADAEMAERASGGSSRGRIVSRLAAALAGLDIELLGVAGDVGVAAQVAPGLRVVVAGLSDAGAVADAVRRGAIAGIVLPGVVGGDLAEAERVAVLVEAARAG